MFDGWMTGMGWMWGLPMVLLILLLSVAIYLGMKATSRSRGAVVARSPEDVLKRRYARGEISAEEYEEKLRRLRR